MPGRSSLTARLTIIATPGVGKSSAQSVRRCTRATPSFRKFAFCFRKTESGVDRLMEFLDRGVAILDLQLQPELPPVRKLLKRYHDVPMSLADACLVRMSELFEESVILTLNKDFLIYRRNGRDYCGIRPTRFPILLRRVTPVFTSHVHTPDIIIRPVR